MSSLTSVALYNRRFSYWNLETSIYLPKHILCFMSSKIDFHGANLTLSYGKTCFEIELIIFSNTHLTKITVKIRISSHLSLKMIRHSGMHTNLKNSLMVGKAL